MPHNPLKIGPWFCVLGWRWRRNSGGETSPRCGNARTLSSRRRWRSRWIKATRRWLRWPWTRSSCCSALARPLTHNMLEASMCCDWWVGVSDISDKNYRMPINQLFSNYRQNYRYRKLQTLKLSKNYRYRKMPQNLSDKYMESQTIRK